jgi:hypothetical protein
VDWVLRGTLRCGDGALEDDWMGIEQEAREEVRLRGSFRAKN